MSYAFRGHQAPQSINCLVIRCSQKKGFLVSFMIMWCKFFPTQMCLMNITPSWIISPPRLLLLRAAHDGWRHRLFPEPCTPDAPVRCQHADSMHPAPSPPPLQEYKKIRILSSRPFHGAKCFPQLLAQQPRTLNLPVRLHHVSRRSKLFLEAPVYFLREMLVTFILHGIKRNVFKISSWHPKSRAANNGHSKQVPLGMGRYLDLQRKTSPIKF